MTVRQHTYHGLKNVQKIRGTTVPTVTNLHFDWYVQTLRMRSLIKISPKVPMSAVFV